MSRQGWNTDRPLRVLHVEDDPAHAELVRRGLSEHRIPNQTRWARNAAEAMELLLDAGKPRPDVVLLDLRLPGDDGFEVLRRVRSTPGLEDLPVAVLTSSQDEADRLRSYEEWVDGYIVKPLDIEGFSVLLDVLMMLIRRRRDQ